MWQIFSDEEYKGHLISVYKFEAAGQSDGNFEVRVRKGTGLDSYGDWNDALYIGLTDSYENALYFGKEFVDRMASTER